MCAIYVRVVLVTRGIVFNYKRIHFVDFVVMCSKCSFRGWNGTTSKLLSRDSTRSEGFVQRPDETLLGPRRDSILGPRRDPYSVPDETLLGR